MYALGESIGGRDARWLGQGCCVADTDGSWWNALKILKAASYNCVAPWAPCFGAEGCYLFHSIHCVTLELEKNKINLDRCCKPVNFGGKSCNGQLEGSKEQHSYRSSCGLLQVLMFIILGGEETTVYTLNAKTSSQIYDNIADCVRSGLLWPEEFCS
ncbi:hypothetical protein QQP08_002916 [Theobroma cacao]|nr:hypothetical protein QQP08_002916 [Theobroma cacao]